MSEQDESREAIQPIHSVAGDIMQGLTNENRMRGNIGCVVTRACDGLGTAYNRLSEENERLREALEKIANTKKPEIYGYDCTVMEAKQALETKIENKS